MESDFEFKWRNESDDSEHIFIPGYEIEVEETSVNEWHAA